MKEIILTKIDNYDLDNETDEYIYLADDKEITEKEYATIYYCKHLAYEKVETFYFNDGFSTRKSNIINRRGINKVWQVVIKKRELKGVTLFLPV